jgi:hypothetical protein
VDDQIKDKLLAYLSSVEGSVEKALDFTSDQVPLYVQELCEYGFFSNAVSATICLFVALALFVLICVVNFLCRKIDDGVLRLCIFIVSSLFGLCFIGMAVDFGVRDACQAYKCKYAPRVYVVEEISRLVK